MPSNKPAPISSLLSLPTPVETHSGIDVKREDLINAELPSGKLRGVLPYFQELAGHKATAVLNYATSHSNSHAVTAWAAREAGLHAFSLVNANHDTEEVAYAVRLGCTMIRVGPMRLTMMHSEAAVAAEKAKAVLLPWAFGEPAIIRRIGDGMIETMPFTYDAHVVALGGGGYAVALWKAALQMSLATNIIAVPVMGTQKGGVRRIQRLTGGILPPGLIVSPPAQATPTPFPCDTRYEPFAWTVAIQLRDQGQRVLFWNVGQHLIGTYS